MGRFILETIDLVKNFAGVRALDQLSFRIEHGQIKSIIGPNGAGKTTLFNLICRILLITEGRINFNGESINDLRPNQIAIKGISRTFQNVRLFGDMSVLENVMIGRQCGVKNKILSAAFCLPATNKRERVIERDSMDILSFLGIEQFAHESAKNISFGQQKMVELARALATSPKLLLLDEPASGLNDYERQQLAILIYKIREKGITILLVAHNMDLVMKVSDEILVLNYGEKIAEGIPSEIQKNREVINAYLGEEIEYA